jgi:hypothetical protein
MEVQKLQIGFTTPLRIVHTIEDGGRSGQRITITYGGFSVTAEGDNVMYTLPMDHLVRMKVSYVDAAGNPAEIDDEVEWAVSDEAIATIEVDPQDSSVVTVTPEGLGIAQVTATVDADLGDGVRELITIADIEIVAGEAMAGSIAPVGPPEPIAPHAEPR